MGAAVCLREDYDAAQMRGLAKGSSDAAQTRRLLALAMIYDGGSRTEAAKIGGVGLQSVRDWVLAFNAEGPPGLVNGKAPGNASLLTPAYRQALLRIVESGPIQPRLPLLRRHPRPLLPCLEQARRPALDHHVDRAS